MATIKHEHVKVMAEYFQRWDDQCVRSIKQPLAMIADTYKKEGFSPVRFRADMRRRAVDRSWFQDMLDTLPNCTDNAIDTAIRSALKLQGFPADHWALSQPLKR